MDMLKLSTGPLLDKTGGTFLDQFSRRVKAMPPGMCPVAVVAAQVKLAEMQTCGKCVPCRDGIPQMSALLEKILHCQATPDDAIELRRLAELVQDSSDCVIGYGIGQTVLDFIGVYKEDFEAHTNGHACMHEVDQKLPCEALCPAHVNIPSYIAYVGEGDYESAIKVMRQDNPFPTACAFVCEHPCEARCRRAMIDSPVNIRGVKKFMVDQTHADTVSVPDRLPDTGKHIAVIGGGPSGLTCAYFSALMGHKVTVFEGRKKLGGMMRYGIPAYRFPRERLDEDIRAILSVGNIDVKYETQIDTDTLKQIACEFDAVYVAIGAQGGKSLRLENVNAEGVSSAVDLLSKIGNGDWLPDFTGKKVAVIGGGNVAMDCCRTAVRAGAEEVNCIYRRRMEDMTALPTEIESAIAEGVEMLTLESPVSIQVNEAGHCTAVITQPQMISAVKRGRPAPIDADKPQNRIQADIVLLAVGQAVVSAPFEEFGMEAQWGAFVADDHLLSPGFDNVFVGGDCQTGPATVIRAIGAGKLVARNIDTYLGYNHKLTRLPEPPAPKPNDRTAYGRVDITERPARVRKLDFEGVENEMSREEAIQECGRCLRCDHFGCGILEGGRIQYV